MASLPQRFGRAVSRLREASGYFQERFAWTARIDRRYYTKIENGEANVSLEIIARVARGLRISLPDLFAAVQDE